MTVPINMVLALDIERIILNAAVTGQIVATTTLPIPEPSTWLLSSVGVVGLLAVGRRRLWRH